MTRWKSVDEAYERFAADAETERPPRARLHDEGERILFTLEQLLHFENQWPSESSAKDAAIRTTFHLPAVRYYQHLNRAIDNPAALHIDPILIHRLQQNRTQRLADRQSRTFERRTS